MEQFTQKAKEALQHAYDVSEELGHGYMGSEHLLCGIIREQSCVAAQVLNTFGINEASVMPLIERLISGTGCHGVWRTAAIHPVPDIYLNRAAGRRPSSGPLLSALSNTHSHAEAAGLRSLQDTQYPGSQRTGHLSGDRGLHGRGRR